MSAWFLDSELSTCYTTKVIMSDSQNCCSDEHLSTAPWYSFYLLLLSFHLQMACRMVRNLQIVVYKLVGKSINLLHHTKSAACIIINVPAVVQVSVQINQVLLYSEK